MSTIDDRAQWTLGNYAKISMLNSQTALKVLATDLRENEPCRGWMYLLHEPFFKEMFHDHLSRAQLEIIVDHLQRDLAAKLVGEYKQLTARSWSGNRTMHDKTIFFPRAGIAWLTTANLTRGSWTLATNRFVRVHSRQFTNDLNEVWWQTWQAARPILASSTTGAE